MSLDLIRVPVEHLVKILVKTGNADLSVGKREGSLLIRNELVSRGVRCHRVTTATTASEV